MCIILVLVLLLIVRVISIFGKLAKLVDALDLGSNVEKRVGSSPSFPTKESISLQGADYSCKGRQRTSWPEGD